MGEQQATSATPESLIPRFELERILNQNEAGRRVVLLGGILDETLSFDPQPAILILERAPWPSTHAYLENITKILQDVETLGNNDIYRWYMGSTGLSDRGRSALRDSENPESVFQDVKINLIYPCTAQHIQKYSRQGVRLVCETAEIYETKVKPYMEKKRAKGALNWVYNIIEGKKEVEDVIFRTPSGEAGDEGFLMLPDLNWDRKTIGSMHLLAIVERRDIMSMRDLKKKHVKWLRVMKDHLLDATVKCYKNKGVERDQLKLYVHYQPTYYHFHVHIVNVALDAGGTQAIGKAVGLESIIETLEHMAGDQDSGMEKLEVCYTVGEASELWTNIFEPLKNDTSSR